MGQAGRGPGRHCKPGAVFCTGVILASVVCQLRYDRFVLYVVSQPLCPVTRWADTALGTSDELVAAMIDGEAPCPSENARLLFTPIRLLHIPAADLSAELHAAAHSP